MIHVEANNLVESLDVVAKYVYFEEGKAPTKEDIHRSEVLEGRLREGFVRIRQLLVRPRLRPRVNDILENVSLTRIPPSGSH